MNKDSSSITKASTNEDGWISMTAVKRRAKRARLNQPIKKKSTTVWPKLISVDKPTIQSKITQFVSKKTIPSSRNGKKTHQRVNNQNTVSCSHLFPVEILDATEKMSEIDCSNIEVSVVESSHSTNNDISVNNKRLFSRLINDDESSVVGFREKENCHNSLIVIEPTQQVSNMHKNQDKVHNESAQAQQTNLYCSAPSDNSFHDKENLKESLLSTELPDKSISHNKFNDMGSDDTECCDDEIPDNQCNYSSQEDDSQPNIVPETQPSVSPQIPSPATDYAYLNFMKEIKEDKRRQSTQNVSDWGYFNFAAGLKKDDEKQSTQRAPLSMPFTQFS